MGSKSKFGTRDGTWTKQDYFLRSVFYCVFHSLEGQAILCIGGISKCFIASYICIHEP